MQSEDCGPHAFLPEAYLPIGPCLSLPLSLSLPVNDIAVVGVESHKAYFQSRVPYSQE